MPHLPPPPLSSTLPNMKRCLQPPAVDRVARSLYPSAGRIRVHVFRHLSSGGGGARRLAAVHADASLTQVGERQMSHAAERGGRLCLFVARSALSLALQALNGTPQSEVTPHESCFSCVQPAPSNYKTLSRQ
ncbi:hypothetical protein EVAR_41997_1 [Eumeta japonica]|uniref:Uncharacterized protein n=1 Tax=Eumeta variegata TaxID=151549 RepID=A0A4C1WPS5_EUMVA|nr:hypothetical protein EVAR_41997_1 [Eumeta japonica]